MGSIPQQYQTGLDLIGLSGNINKGMELLKKSASYDSNPFQHEAATIYTFMLLHIQNEPEKAWTYLKLHDFLPQYNLMDAYTFGHIGIYGTHNDEGLQALFKPTHKQYFYFVSYVPLFNWLGQNL
ncbi:MAG: hypothetical protein LRY27_00055 [Chitinophagales bacterium]|nr:hypothetical protein [Chitinophagales bacterium]